MSLKSAVATSCRPSLLPLTSAAEQSAPNSACSSFPLTMKWMIFVVMPEPGGTWPSSRNENETSWHWHLDSVKGHLQLTESPPTHSSTHPLPLLLLQGLVLLLGPAGRCRHSAASLTCKALRRLPWDMLRFTMANNDFVVFNYNEWRVKRQLNVLNIEMAWWLNAK